MSNVHKYPLVIREFHLDTFGHMNNAAYLQVLEEARWELITSRGFGMDHIKKVGQGPVILEVNLKFLRELKLRESVIITTELLDYESKVGHLKQTIVKENGEVAAEAIFTISLFDTINRKIIPPTTDWARAVGKS